MTAAETVCVVPWRSVVVRPNGIVLACCHATGSMGSLYERSLEEIWNGDRMTGLRAALGRGERHPACDACWEHERAGVGSPRQGANESARVSEDRQLVERLLTEGPALGYRAEAPPYLYTLQLGNLCNLKCRSCHEVASSRIASDPVHRAWSYGRIGPEWDGDRLELPVDGRAVDVATEGSRLRAISLRLTGRARLRVTADDDVVREVVLDTGTHELAVETSKIDRLRLAFEGEVELHALALTRAPAQRSLPIVPAGRAAWFKHIAALADSVSRHPQGAMVFLLGGEPFLIDEVWELADELVARGLAQRLILAMSTNCTQRRDELARLAPAFRHVVLQLSLDGYGPMFEYLRYGGRWADVLETLRWMRGLPNVSLAATPTVQNYNILDTVRLFRFLDEQKLPFGYNLLTQPARLSPLNLPPRVRRTAAARLRSYLDGECRPAHRKVVQAYVDILGSTVHPFDPALFREFMLFTNDLDVSRRQRFADAAPDLAALIAASGEAWIEDTRHA
jgi:radical SAM protein with 4Fe4S-binding SPASM domain